jgi:hypothetical protein
LAQAQVACYLVVFNTHPKFKNLRKEGDFMTILKIQAITEETEAQKATSREMQKERMVEVKAIRQAIVDLFDSKPYEGFTSGEILEWLNRKGFKVSARQIHPKMKMMRNVFVKGRTLWQRRICEVCKKPFGLDDDLWISGKSERHGPCHESVSELLKPYQNKNCELNGQLNVLLQEKGELLAGNAELKEEVEKLRSMIVFPSQNDSKGTRKIILD